MAALSLAAAPFALSAEAIAANQEEGAQGILRAEPGDAPASMEETLARIDALLARLDARTKDAWARAQEVLDLADAATDPEEQMRLEELYGKMADVAGSFEEQYSRLSTLRNELAAARNRMPP